MNGDKMSTATDLTVSIDTAESVVPAARSASIASETSAPTDKTPSPSSRTKKNRERFSTIGWWCLSVGIFSSVWELCWYMGWADPLLMPPPHIFLSNLSGQFKFFDLANTIGSEEKG